jgi:hypothetical protein
MEKQYGKGDMASLTDIQIKKEYCPKCGSECVNTAIDVVLPSFDTKTGKHEMATRFSVVCPNHLHWWDGHTNRHWGTDDPIDWA